jgi:hypothetical protein
MSINSFRAPIAISAASVAAAVRFAQYARISIPVKKILTAAAVGLSEFPVGHGSQVRGGGRERQRTGAVTAPMFKRVARQEG